MGCRNLGRIAFAFLILQGSVATTKGASAQALQPGLRTFSGRVHDIDFAGNSGGRRQVLAISGPTSEFVGSTASAHVQAVLQAPLLRRTPVTIRYVDGTPNNVVSVRLPVSPSVAEGLEFVDCDSMTQSCPGSVMQRDGRKVLRTTNLRALGVLLTSIQGSVPLTNVTVGPDGSISRVTVNTK
jgi:hypothetical protein